jgi:hypothetical protein
MKRYPEWLLGTLTVAITVAICVVVAEVVLRFLPVASSLYTVPVTAQSPVFHFTPNRDFVYSRDWDMVLAHRGHVNNAGFVNDQDYQKDGSLPMLAVVGDSMIEAAMVPYRDTLQGRLATVLAGKLRVYSFATAGAPLSQYLIWARHAVREYGAQALVISVVGNDFDESHSAYKTSPGFWHYVPDANGELQLQLFEYRPGRLRDVVVASALARYLLFNMQVGLHWIELKSLLFGRPAMAAPLHTASNLDDKRLRDSLAAVDAFFRDLPAYAGLPASRILFVVDGFRYPDAAAAHAGSYSDRVRRALLEKAMSLGYDAIDLDPIFFERHRRTGERFEFARDGHWSAVGHGATFDAVMASRFMLRLLDNSNRNAQGRSGVSRARPVDVTFALPDLSVGRVNHPAGGAVAGPFPDATMAPK